VTAAASTRRFTGDFRADVLVAVVVAAALVGAFFYKQSLSAQTTRVSDPHSGFALSIPGHWATKDAGELSADTFVEAFNPRADSVYKSTVIGQSFLIDSDNPVAIATIVDRIIQRHGDELLGYQLLDILSTTVAGAEAQQIDYAYVARPIDDPFMASPPVIVLATDYVVYAPTEYWIVTLTVDEQIASKEQADFGAIVKSIMLP
jgi:hypothetical protein